MAAGLLLMAMLASNGSPVLDRDMHAGSSPVAQAALPGAVLAAAVCDAGCATGSGEPCGNACSSHCPCGAGYSGCGLGAFALAALSNFVAPPASAGHPIAVLLPQAGLSGSPGKPPPRLV
jgi:hypothetical protein